MVALRIRAKGRRYDSLRDRQLFDGRVAAELMRMCNTLCDPTERISFLDLAAEDRVRNMPGPGRRWSCFLLAWRVVFNLQSE
jgi:hypothetical protein